MKLSGPPAPRQNGVFFPQRREVGSGAGTPLEQHAFRLRQVQDGFQRVLHADDEAGRALRPRHAFQFGHPPLLLVVDPAVAPRLLDAHVEPHRGIEAGLLGEHQVGQFHAEIFTILRALEVPVLLAPVRDRVHHATVTSTSRCSKITEPLSLPIEAVRVSHWISSYGVLPASSLVVKYRGNSIPVLVCLGFWVFKDSIFALKSTDNCPIRWPLPGFLLGGTPS